MFMLPNFFPARSALSVPYSGCCGILACQKGPGIPPPPIHMGVSKNNGPQKRPKYNTFLIERTPKLVPLIFANTHSATWNLRVGAKRNQGTKRVYGASNADDAQMSQGHNSLYYRGMMQGSYFKGENLGILYSGLTKKLPGSA